ncbi:MAG: hypothetical protein ACREOY_05185 [Candidatus Dormibacteraceae bacterium]
MPSGAMSGGSVKDSGALSQVIKHLVGRLDGKETRAMIAASDSVASFRVFTFPRDTAEVKIDSFVRTQLPEDGNRMGVQHIDVTDNGSDRTVFAVAFDRLKVQELASAVRMAGLEPSVLELKSLCVARVAPQSACVVLDLTVEPAEVFLIDRGLPRLWHSFKADVESDEELVQRVAGGLGVVLSFYLRQPGARDFSAEAPIFITSEAPLPPGLAAALQARVGHPFQSLPVPPRVSPEVQHGAYLACIGLVMRRR